MRYLVLTSLACCLLAAGLPAPADENVTASEVARTPEGKITLYYRTTADAAELHLPFFPDGTVSDSLVYCAQDRKGRNLLYYARASLTTTGSSETVQAFYRAALGVDAAREADVQTGVVTLTVGTADHFRLVRITPREGGCSVRLERVQEFLIPPRVYTAEEQPIVRLLEQLTTTYGTARRVSYTMEQRSLLPDATPGTPAPPVLTWSVAYTRPAQMHIVAKAAGQVGLEITAGNGKMKVHRQTGDNTRVLDGPLTLDDLPDLEMDPVARLMLGQPILTPLLETIKSRPVAGVSTDRQIEVVLTFPDTDTTLKLLVDVRARRILRSETTVIDEGDTITVIRTYTGTEIMPQATTGPATPGKGKPGPAARPRGSPGRATR